MPHPKLIGCGFGHFVATESLDQWDKHVISVLGNEEAQTCDLRLKREDESLFYASLNSVRVEKPGEYAIQIAFTDITQRKLMETALRESEEKYRSLFNNAEVGMFRTRLDGSEVCDFNDKFLKILNRTREEVIGKPSVTLWADPHEREEMVRKLKIDGYINSFECKLLTAQGEERICLMSSRFYPESAILEGSIMDITERKRATELGQLLIAAVEHTADGVLITDAKGIIQYVNPAQETLSGYSLDELVGQTPNILLSDKHDDNFNGDIWDTVNAGNIWSGRFTNKKKDGTEYYEDASLSPIYDKSGKLTNFVAVKHDVTKQLELRNNFSKPKRWKT